jgi:hypothetical protein
MFTLEQKKVHCAVLLQKCEKDLRTANYSTPGVFDEFQQKFPDFQTFINNLPRKCSAQKGSGRPTKRTETNLSFGTVQFILKKDLHFFPCRVSVVHEIKPLDNKSPHNITSLNIDR